MFLEFENEIEKIMENIDCPRDFECYKANFENLCVSKDFLGIENYVECGCDSCPHSPANCKFGFDFGMSYFCKCPLRVFVAKRMK
ncbi:MAG: hypothetical protein R6U44_08905 [Archaeoglobaceae archaeon]